MILYPPERFDLNEWFTLISLAVTLIIAFLLPKRFSPAAITVYCVFTVFLSQSVDSLIAVKPFDLYDVSDSSKYEIIDAVIYYVNYPPYTYFFMYFYDKWQLKGVWRVLYVVLYSGLSVFFEWLAVLCGVFKFKGWKLGYSPFVYVVVFVMYILVYHLTRKLLHEETLESH
ncbi:hypothetical protein ACFPES_29010 [Paenibacillus sp. GCM10023248]|uniref:hypothetical protein n=1 Tax=Bacillales TaxID=1385 RepID=UPI002379D25F|nr:MULTISPECIES: hypothetical protein [Bacillales]MDD9271094.1 hypothetical protein [Paenibacillus sp. MAHUQ-63]MDR6885065.1 hypothetical protein [Bacillus sp. 3255]